MNKNKLPKNKRYHSNVLLISILELLFNNSEYLEKIQNKLDDS